MYQNGNVHFIDLPHPVVYTSYSSNCDSSNIPIYITYARKMAIYDLKSGNHDFIL